MEDQEKISVKQVTITAICSGAGSSITVIRISGPDAGTICLKVFKSRKSPMDFPREMILGRVIASDDPLGETAFAVYMPSPRTYTGEDIVEIHAHGGTFNSRRILEEVIRNGAIPAKPGEFTYRAFINGKLDLTQAEAVADLISAGSRMSVRLAERQMNGALGRKIAGIRMKLLEILTETEARTDFPEEELDFIPVQEALKALDEASGKIKQLYDTRYEGIVLREGVRTVIAGRPNAGKSSLLNLLLGYDRAITTDIPGTTRDTLEELTNIRGIPVRLIDTAGIRNSENRIEELGIMRSISSLKEASIVIWLLDASSGDSAIEVSEMKSQTTPDMNVIPVWNKIDLLSHESALPETFSRFIRISVKTQAGIEELQDEIEKRIWSTSHHSEPEMAISSRHAAELEKALSAIPEAAADLSAENWELAAVNLKTAVMSLGNIIGEDPTIDIYETIFSKFCIGK